MTTTILATLIVAAIGLLGVIVAQVVSHRLTKERETHKQNIEIYQKVFAPILLDIMMFLDVKSNSYPYTKEEDKLNKIRDKIISHLEVNIIHISKSADKYHELKKYTNLYDYEIIPPYLEIELFLNVLEESYDLIQKLPISEHSNQQLSKLVNYKMLYLLWFIFSKKYENINIISPISHILKNSINISNNTVYKSINAKKAFLSSKEYAHDKTIYYIVKKLTAADHFKDSLFSMSAHIIGAAKEKHNFTELVIVDDNDDSYDMIDLLKKLRPRIDTEKAKEYEIQVSILAYLFDLTIGREGDFASDTIDELLRVHEWAKSYQL